jgi:hypothetical protein
MPTRSPMARNSAHQTVSSVTVLTRWVLTIVGKDVLYKQVLTDPGMFAIIYDGASGAMQSFHRLGTMRCAGSSPM